MTAQQKFETQAGFLEEARHILAAPKPDITKLDELRAAAKAEFERASAEVDQLQARRRELLVTGTDDELAAHDALQAAETRARDRAAAVVEAVDKRIADLAVEDRRVQITAQRDAAEAAVQKAVAGLRRYPKLADGIRDILGSVSEADRLIEEFARHHPDEPAIRKPEQIVRWTAAADRHDIETAEVKCWSFATTGDRLSIESCERVNVTGQLDGVRIGFLPSEPNSFQRFPQSVVERSFKRTAYRPAVRAEWLPSLSETVVLPPLRPDEKRVKPDLEVEFLPVDPPIEAEEFAAARAAGLPPPARVA